MTTAASGWANPVATVAVWPDPETTATDAAAPGALVSPKLAAVVTPAAEAVTV